MSLYQCKFHHLPKYCHIFSTQMSIYQCKFYHLLNYCHIFSDMAEQTIDWSLNPEMTDEEREKLRKQTKEQLINLIDENKKTTNELQAENQSLKQSDQLRTTEMTDLRSDLETTQNDRDAKAKLITDHVNEIANLNKRIETLEGEMRVTDNNADGFKSQVQTLEGNKTNLESELSAKNKEIQELKSQIENLNATNVALTKEKEQCDLKIKEINDQNETHLNSIITLKSQLRQKESSVDVLMDRLGKARKENTDSAKPDKVQPKALFIIDNNINTGNFVFDKKGANWDWLKISTWEELKQLIDSKPEERERLFKYDAALILLGHQDIISGGADGFEVIQRIEKVVEQLIELQINVTVCELPPLKGEPNTDVVICNRFIVNIDKIKVISMKKVVNDMLIEDFITKQAVITGQGLKNLVNIIDANLTAPVKIEKTPMDKANIESSETEAKASTSDELDIDLDLDLDLEDLGNGSEWLEFESKSHCGLIIGKSGSTVRALQAKTGAVIKVKDKMWKGKFYCGAVLIGDSDVIEKAKSSIKSLIKKDESQKAKRSADRNNNNGPPKEKKMKL